MNLILKIWNKKWILRNILQTLYINFHYLPFKQAIKLPILVYKPKFIKNKGKIIITNESCKFGMIVLGKFISPLYSNTGFSFYNEGTIIFRGNCKIGNESNIIVTKDANLIFGDRFQATAAFKINCSYRITFGNDVLIGYNSNFIDTDLHHVTMINGKLPPKPFGEIIIGDGCWFGFNNVIMKNTTIPQYCIIASNSLCNKHYNCSKYSLLAGMPAVVKKEHVSYLNPQDYIINYKLYD